MVEVKKHFRTKAQMCLRAVAVKIVNQHEDNDGAQKFLFQCERERGENEIFHTIKAAFHE